MSRDLYGLRHFKEQVWRRNVPAFGPSTRGWGITRISGRSIGLSPIRDGCDVSLSQRGIVEKMSIAGIGEPGRHHLHLDGMCDCVGPRLRLLVGNERHGSNFASTMTALTVVLQNRQHVFVEGGRWMLFQQGCLPRHVPPEKKG